MEKITRFPNAKCQVELTLDEKIYKFDKFNPPRVQQKSEPKPDEYIKYYNKIEWAKIPIVFDENGKCLNIQEIMAKNCLVTGADH